MNLTHKEPKLVESNRGWYIDYSIFDEVKQTWIRKRYSKGFSLYKTASAKRKYGRKVLGEINKMLYEGYVIAREEISLKEAYEKYHNFKAPSLINPNNYKTLRNSLFYWLEKKGLNEISIDKFSRKHAIMFLDDYIRAEKRLGAVTYNRYLQILGNFFDYYMDREIIDKKPTKGIKTLTITDSDMHKPYTREQISKIKEECFKRGEKMLWLYISFIFYSFIRKSELQKLKVEYIKEQAIFFPGRSSKNKKALPIRIAPALNKIINEYGLRQLPAGHYVFGYGGKTGPKQGYAGHFNTKLKNILEDLGWDDQNHTIYGFKHSGVIELFGLSKTLQDLRLIQEMCRHHSFAMTEKYLRGLGLILPINDEILGKMSEF